MLTDWIRLLGRMDDVLRLHQRLRQLHRRIIVFSVTSARLGILLMVRLLLLMVVVVVVTMTF